MLKEKLHKSESEYAAFKKKGDEKNAYFSLKRIAELKELIFEKEKQDKIKELEDFYASKEKDLMIAQENAYKEKLQDKNTKLSEIIRKQQLVKLQLESLQLQLNPHFIFNTLQSIQSYVFNQSPLEASDYLGKFAALMRGILSASRLDRVSLESEIKLIGTYLEIEQIRFGKMFDFDIQVNIEAPAEEIFMPPLLLQPFLENAIIHGVTNIENGEIKVFIRQKLSSVYVHIYDNGIGRFAANKFQKSTQQGPRSGFEILADRQKLSQETGDFNYWLKVGDIVKDKVVRGTYVIIRIQDLKVYNYG